MTTLAQAELLRYSRHLILPDVGVPGQEKLKAARVLLIGAGGLGSPAALYLAAAGVGTLGLVDFDNVDIKNLQRQILHGTKDVGRPKLLSARERIADVNPHVRLETYEKALTSDRKSTRLNSSHLGISYAVFCLKKKNIKANHSERRTTQMWMCGARSMTERYRVGG